MAITYDYYRIFYYVAKYRSFTQAAHILLNSQPNITRSMNNLEHELGCRLFVRSNRGVQLTPEGEKLFVHVSIAHEQLQEAEAELTGDRELRRGVVSIGASETALHGYLLSRLGDFHGKYPGIRMRISNHSTPQAVASLKSGNVDFAVVTTPTGVCRPLEEIHLKTFREILVAGPQFFPKLARRTVTLEELSGLPMVSLGRETKTYEFYNQFFLDYGVLWEPDMEAATTDQVLPLVKSGLGLGFLPEDFAGEAVRRGEVFVVDLKEEIPERAICLVKDGGKPLSIAAREFEKMLRKESV